MRKKIIGLCIIVIALIGFATISANAISRDEAVNWAKAQVGVEYDVDGINGYQCSDFGTAYINYLISGNPYSGNYTTYMGYNYYGLSYPDGWQRIENTPDFVPEPGDILCFAGSSNNSAGHVAVAIEGCTTSVMYGLGQNGLANNEWGEAVKYETLQYYGAWGNFQGVIRPKWNSTPVPEKNTWVSTDKVAYNVGETVTFTFEYKYGTSVSLGIDRNGSRYATPDVTGKASYSMSFSDPGTYTVYVSGWSQSGYEDSQTVQFLVDSGLSNSDTWIKADKTTCYVGDTVNFTFGYKYTTSVSLGIDRVYAERYANPEVTGKTSYSFKFNDVGVYSVYVSGWSYTGYEDSGQVIITVKERPTSISGSLEKYSNVYIAKASITNLKQSAVYAAALYSPDGKLLDVQTTPVASGATSADVAFTKQTGAAYVKVFLWDNLNSMQPLTESERINL